MIKLSREFSMCQTYLQVSCFGEMLLFSLFNMLENVNTELIEEFCPFVLLSGRLPAFIDACFSLIMILSNSEQNNDFRPHKTQFFVMSFVCRTGRFMVFGNGKWRRGWYERSSLKRDWRLFVLNFEKILMKSLVK